MISPVGAPSYSQYLVMLAESDESPDPERSEKPSPKAFDNAVHLTKKVDLNNLIRIAGLEKKSGTAGKVEEEKQMSSLEKALDAGKEIDLNSKFQKEMKSFDKSSRSKGTDDKNLNALDRSLEATKSLDLNSSFRMALNSFDRIGKPIDILTRKSDAIKKFVF